MHWYVRSKSPLATDNLLEDTDGGYSISVLSGAAACYLLYMLTRAILMVAVVVSKVKIDTLVILMGTRKHVMNSHTGPPVSAGLRAMGA